MSRKQSRVRGLWHEKVAKWTDTSRIASPRFEKRVNHSRNWLYLQIWIFFRGEIRLRELPVAKGKQSSKEIERQEHNDATEKGQQHTSLDERSDKLCDLQIVMKVG